MSDETFGAKMNAGTVPQSQSSGWHCPHACIFRAEPCCIISSFVIPRVSGSVLVHVPVNWLTDAQLEAWNTSSINTKDETVTMIFFM